MFCFNKENESIKDKIRRRNQYREMAIRKIKTRFLEEHKNRPGTVAIYKGNISNEWVDLSNGDEVKVNTLGVSSTSLITVFLPSGHYTFCYVDEDLIESRTLKKEIDKRESKLREEIMERERLTKIIAGDIDCRIMRDGVISLD